MHVKRVAVVTSSRADWSHLAPVAALLRDAPDVDLRLIATGAMLAPEFGRAADVIEASGFEIDARVECLLSADSDSAMARTIGVATLGMTDVLDRLRPDLLVVTADRFEMLAPASVALALRIPLVHIEGGEASEGAIDHAVRNALTMMSHLHFVPTDLARRRVIAMGEQPWRVHRVGAPSLDVLRGAALPERAALVRALGHDLDDDAVVVAYHPVTLDADPIAGLEALLAAFEDVPAQVIFCHPNADAGGRAIAARLRDCAARRPRTSVQINLDPLHYWALLREAAAMCGNSSSGIMESASIPVPAVNIGRRQAGRERAATVIDVAAERDVIAVGLRLALSPDFRAALDGVKNPYGDGQSAARIVEALRAAPPARVLLDKPAWLPPDGVPTFPS